jgi:3',5'-cyclic AMP phosphodiesterase CpdA
MSAFCDALFHKYWVDSNEFLLLSEFEFSCAHNWKLIWFWWAESLSRQTLERMIWKYNYFMLDSKFDFDFWCLVLSDVSCLMTFISNLTHWSSKELLKHHHLSLHSTHVWHHSHQTDAVYNVYVISLRLHCLFKCTLSARTDYHNLFERHL